jgi:hypothetical protein
MGLLDDFPYGLLNQIRNGTQSQITNGNFSAGDANGFPSRVPQQQQRLPLSFAGPDLTTDITASSPGRSADFLRAQPPAPPASNLTVQALRRKGVPESDIAAAVNNPDLLKHLIIQHYRPASGSTGPWIRYAADDRSAGRDPSDSALPNANSEINRFDDAHLHPELTAPQQVGLKCVGWNGCPNRGSFGHGGMYSVGGQILCESCAVKKTGGELLPSPEKTDILRPYLIGGGK